MRMHLIRYPKITTKMIFRKKLADFYQKKVGVISFADLTDF
jgi:hypothetical protein